MNVLITGGLGFIGSSLALSLCKKHNVVLFDREYNNKGVKIYENYPLTFIQGDICNKNDLDKLLQQTPFDCIIFLSAISRVVIAQKKPQECIRVNEMGVRTFLNALANSQSKEATLIFGSSREVYGNPKKLPVIETDVKKPINIYGETKLKGEMLFARYAREFKNSCGILRFSNVYGNGFDLLGRVLPRFIYGIANDLEIILEGGGQIIDFTHINDTVACIDKSIELFTNSKGLIEDLHILPGVGWSLKEAIEIIEATLHKSARVILRDKRCYDVECFRGDPSKVKSMLDFNSFISLQDGLREAIPLYLKVMEDKNILKSELQKENI